MKKKKSKANCIVYNHQNCLSSSGVYYLKIFQSSFHSKCIQRNSLRVIIDIEGSLIFNDSVGTINLHSIILGR